LSAGKDFVVVDEGERNDVIEKFKPLKMGMQVSCGVYPKMLEKGFVWKDIKVSGTGVSLNWHGRRRARSRAYADGSCAYADQHTAEIYSIDGWV
jgi:hypothetical protein